MSTRCPSMLPLPVPSAGWRRMLRQAGRTPSTRSDDALIAAVALSRGLALYTANCKDVEATGDLTVSDVLAADPTGVRPAQ